MADYNKRAVQLKGPVYVPRSTALKSGWQKNTFKDYRKKSVILKGPVYMQKSVVKKYGFGKEYAPRESETAKIPKKVLKIDDSITKSPENSGRSIRHPTEQDRDRMNLLENFSNTTKSDPIRRSTYGISRFKSGLISMKRHEKFGSNLTVDHAEYFDEFVEDVDVTLKDNLVKYYPLFPELDVTNLSEMTGSQEQIVKDNLKQMEEFRNYLTSVQNRILTPNINLEEEQSSSESSDDSKSWKNKNEAQRCFKFRSWIKRIFKK